MNPVIDVVNLSCRYRKTEAVRGISFAVEPGTVFGLLGPNGAGKTVYAGTVTRSVTLADFVIPEE